MAKVELQSTKDPSRRKMASPRDAKVLVKMGRWEYVTTAFEGGAPKPPKRRRTPAKPKPVEPTPAPPTEPAPPHEPTSPAEPTP